MIAENIPRRSGLYSPRAFHPWSRIYRSPSGSLKKIFFLSARIGRSIQLYGGSVTSPILSESPSNPR